ncbi:synaptic plasticity regulator PANTS [Halyomorpha halys]|uniref:synaptic plasticity regulator PANTS n=1 Tax=Halyomorpha halys TaxID=286706 RepID=UPI0006D4D29B|nr:UPF0545 protein C22orf39 homolog [Halyomorpha halys]
MVVSDEFIEKNSWMVRRCLLYNDEYNDCTSIHARIHQYFVKGKMEDCGQWKRCYNNCVKWEETEDRRAFKELIDDELDRRKKRLSGHLENDVWEKRTEPPAHWNDPLPPHIEERIKNSYLSLRSQEIKGEPSQKSSSLCVIS